MLYFTHLPFFRMNELKALHDKSMRRTAYGSTHSMRKRPNDFDR